MPPTVHETPRMRRPVPFLVVLLLAATWSGCLGGPDDGPRAAAGPEATDPDEAQATPPDVATEPPEVERVPLRFPLQRPVAETTRYDGAFSPEETGLGGGFFTGGFRQVLDLTDRVPPEVPVRLAVEVRLDAERVPVVGPTARADPVANETVWYASYWDDPEPGRFLFGGIIKRAANGTIGVALEAYTPGTEDPTQVAYDVTVNVTAQPSAIPTGVPVAFAAEGDATLRFEVEATQQAELLIYGPQDILLDRLFFLGQETWTVPAAAGGELVVVPILGSGGVRILAETNEDGTAPALRALDLHREQGAPQDLAPRAVTRWDFEVERRPLRVLVTVVGPAGEPWACVGSLSVALSAPSGRILEGASDCPAPTNVPFLYEERHTWAAHPGDPRLVTGTYTVAVDNTLWSGHQAYHSVEWYAR